MNPLLSIVSGTYNRLGLLQQMIQSARDQLPKGIHYEVVIVDGGSTDGSLEWLREQPDVRLIEHGELRGAIKAFTEGAEAARGKYVLLANDDVAFHPGSMIKAIVHLENTPRCGAVAFADNRPVISGVKRGHQVMQIWARFSDGKEGGVNYAQVGLFRKWLGDRIGWWYGHGAMEGARIYGGDSYLSARLWETGYTVDAVNGCAVDDFIAADGLRHMNQSAGETDSAVFHKIYPSGVLVAPEPTIRNEDERQLRILYLPIFEPGHEIQHRQKFGLREALAKRYLVYELDYLSSARLREDMLHIIDTFKPDVLFTQLHGADQITPALLQEIRSHAPRLVVINWNGDYWPRGLISEPVLELLKGVDLQLVVNGDVLPEYAARGIPAAYWQIGFEPVDESSLPDVPAHDIVFMGNAYSEERKQFERMLLGLRAEHGFNLGLYGAGWEENMGETLYNFAKGRALYKKARLALGDNQFGATKGYISNRLFEALAAGGALLLYQRVVGLEELTGIREGVHYIGWTDEADLCEKIIYWLDPKHDRQRKKIVKAGREYVLEHHSFDARVRELFIGENALLKRARREIRNTVTVEYIGVNPNQFGITGPSGKQYTCTPGNLLTVDALDAPMMLNTGKFRKVGGVQNDTLARAVEGV